MPSKSLPPHIQAKIDEYKRLRQERLRKENGTSPPTLTTANPVPSSTLQSIQAPSIHRTDRADTDRAITNSLRFQTEYGTDKIEITLNEKQQQAVQYAERGVSFILTGAAGTGKTTTTKAIAEILLQKPDIRKIQTPTKLLHEGMPGVFFLAFTRAAVRNLRKVLPAKWRAHCFTIHKFVEMRPEEVIKVDPETGKEYVSKVYKPFRNSLNPLPWGIQTIIFDESSMISETQYGWIRDAIPYQFQEIFLGDINQLPTVADFSIFPQKLTTLPVIELTHIYRQALESPIIRLAHRIKNGKAPTHEELLNDPEEYKSKQLTIFRFPKSIVDEDVACMKYCDLLKKQMDQGLYDPYNDMILVPWENRFGWREINRWIATFLDRELASRGELLPIHEVISMMRKEYLRIGDKVLYDKNPAIIREINPNGLYVGSPYRDPSIYLSRWGSLVKPTESVAECPITGQVDSEEFDDIDKLLSADIDRLSRQCSHVITIQYEDGEEEKISTNQEFSLLSLGYATTVHKAQGAQWPHVVLMIHKNHYINVNRELLYTACTRAQERLTIICEKDTLAMRAKAQAIKGDSVEAKIEWYRIKLEERKRKEQEKAQPSLFSSDAAFE